MANPGLEDLDNEPLNAERMRRMKSLMRQLYKEEFESNKRLRLPPVKGGNVIVFFSVVTILVFVATTFYNYNKFVQMYQTVLAMRGHVEAAVQRRSNLFDTLVNLTLNHAELERELFRHVADARQKLKKAGLHSSADGVMSKGYSSAGLAQLLAVVEQYPNIKSTTSYQALMTDLIEIEDNIFERRSSVNDAIRIYNTRVNSFPWQYLAALSGFEHIGYYHSEHHKEDKLLLNSTSFVRLLPAVTPAEVPQLVLSPSSSPVVVLPPELKKP